MLTSGAFYIPQAFEPECGSKCLRWLWECTERALKDNIKEVYENTELTK